VLVRAGQQSLSGAPGFQFLLCLAAAACAAPKPDFFEGEANMRKCRGNYLLWCALGVVLAASYSHAIENSTEIKLNAKEAIKKAMEAEIAGDLAGREKWLSEAMSNKSASLAQSQKGLLRVDRSHWLSIEEMAAKIANSEAMKRYEALRSHYVDSVEGNWKLAQACKTAKLPDQAIAHLHRVIELNPDHAAARAALGFEFRNGEWISPELLSQEFHLAKAQAAAVQKHGRMLRELAPQLQSSQEWERERAQYRLASLRDSSVALAAEQILSPISEEMALFVVRYLGDINDPATTYLLTRQAIAHSSPRIREAAAGELGGRELHAYAPRLLAMLSMPIRSEVEAIVTAKGEVTGYRQVFERVAMDRNHVMGSETAQITKKDGREKFLSSSLTNPPANPQRARTQDEAQQMAKASLSPSSLAQQQIALRLNEHIALRNEHVFNILRIATRRDLPSDPQEWWKWYEDQIGVEVTGRDYHETEQLRARMVDSGYNKLLPPRPPYVPGRCECFVAGTRVTTHRGSVEIERIRLGDLVLSKDIESGALAFRPVLQTTVRQPEALVEIRASNDILRCTAGHFFWVSGKGWTKAGELKQGMILHGAENPTRIDEIKEADKEKTYNLRVADNANYFVGNARILSHDVSSRGPSEMAVPGYKAPRDRK
jgi:hypothetical protein